MPAKFCNGEANDTPYLRESIAYCEGRTAATTGAAQNTNPHPAGTDDNGYWDAGWLSYNGGLGTPFIDCCPYPGYS